MIFSLIQLLTLVKLWFLLFVKSHFESLFFLFLCFSFVYFHFKYVWKEHWIFRLQHSVCNQRARHWSQNHWLGFRPWTKYSECYKAVRKVTRNITSHLQRNEKEKRMKYGMENLHYAKYGFLTQVFIWLCNQWRIYVLLYTEIAGDS